MNLLFFFFEAMLYHVVSKNSMSTCVGMQQKYVINGIQYVGASSSGNSKLDD